MKRYLVYAIGEILLVVVGILIALQINNWNEGQKKIKAEHEKYSAIILDLQRDFRRQTFIYKIIGEGEKTLKKAANEFFSDSLSNDQFNFDIMIGILDYYSYVKENHGHLTGELPDKEISNQLASYLYFQYGVDQTVLTQNELANDLRTYFINNGYLNLKSVNNGSEQSLINPNKIMNLAQDVVFQGHLITRNNVLERLRDKVLGLMEVNQRLQVTLADHIKQPLYKNLGIIGTALADGWDQSVAMSPVDGHKSSWEITLDLEDGEVKFRENNEWDNNWGGSGFPHGDLDFDGPNIHVKKGRYTVQVDLFKLTYHFQRIGQ